MNAKLNNRRMAMQLRRDHYRRRAMEAAAGAETGAPAHHHHHAHTPEADKGAEQLREQLIRTKAEFDNFRKRSRRDAEQAIGLANEKLLEQMLPVLDNFDRALAQPGDSVDALLNGVQMIRKQLGDVMAQSGLEKVEALGQPFDPNVHEAVSTGPSDDHADNHVSEVFQEGYRLKNRLIRPAMVKVVKA